MAQEQQKEELNGHQRMAVQIHNVFSSGQGVPVSSAQAEAVVEMKMWLRAIAEGQLHVVTEEEFGLALAAPPMPPAPPEE